MPLKKKYLIFDFDGTLADTFQKLIQISNHLAEEFHFKKITRSEAKKLKHHSVLDIIKELHIPLRKLPAIVQRAQSELHKEITFIKPFTGLKSTLKKLKKNELRLGIITTNSKRNVKLFLQHHNMDHFDDIIPCSKIWGKHAALKKLLKDKSIPKEDVLYIGDETRDIEAANKAGVDMAAVTWGYNTLEALKKMRPDYLIHHPDELAQLCSS